MADYRRFIAYVYEYTQGKKGSGRGFIKVEARNGVCRMNFKLEGISGRGEVPTQVYGYVRENGRAKGVFLGNCNLAGPAVQFEYEMPQDNLGNSGYGLGDLRGLVLMTDTGEAYGSGWEEQPLRVEDIEFPEPAQPEEESRGRDRGEAGGESRGTARGEEYLRGEAPEERLGDRREESSLERPREENFRTGERRLPPEELPMEEFSEQPQESPAEVLSAVPQEEAMGEAMEEFPGDFTGEPGDRAGRTGEPFGEKTTESPLSPGMGGTRGIRTRTSLEGRRAGSTGIVGEMENESGSGSIGRWGTGNETMGNRESGNRAMGNREAGNGAMGNRESGNETMGNWEAGNEAMGNRESGNETMGNWESGNEAMGNRGAGNGTMNSWKNGNPDTDRRRMDDGNIDGRETGNEGMTVGETREQWNNRWENGKEAMSSPGRGTGNVNRRDTRETIDEWETGNEFRSSSEYGNRGMSRQENRNENMSREQEDNRQETGEMAGQSAALAQEESQPIFDGGILDCRKIMPYDFRRLGIREQGLLNNPFLRHGLNHYGHLLLGRREEDGRWILGVPGCYEKQEGMMAGMFGFPFFRECRTSGQSRRFGYWYRMIDLGRRQGNPTFRKS